MPFLALKLEYMKVTLLDFGLVGRLVAQHCLGTSTCPRQKLLENWGEGEDKRHIEEWLLKTLQKKKTLDVRQMRLRTNQIAIIGFDTYL